MASVNEETAVLKLICITMGRECVCHIYEKRGAQYGCLRCDAINAAREHWPHLVAALEQAQNVVGGQNGI